MSSQPSLRSTAGRYRWYICGLLFICTTINYVDRNSLSVLKTTLQASMGWSDVDYGWITFAFTAAYAAFPSIVGNVIDRFGVKKSLAGALVLWSVMAAAHALVRSVFGFAVVRFFLGVAEAANFPASIKAIAMWFPQRERALATGLFNAGTNVGVMVSFVDGVDGLAVGLAVGLHHHRRDRLRVAGVVADRLRYAGAVADASQRRSWRTSRPTSRQPPRSSKIHWTALLRYAQIWPFLIGKLLTDPVWWFYLYWLPSYLERERGQDPLKSALLLGLIYTGACVGSIAGGWLSGLPHLARLAGRRGAADRDAAAGRVDARRGLRLLHGELRGLRRAHHAGDGLPPGMVGEHLHDRYRSLSGESVRRRRRAGCDDGRNWRDVHDAGGRADDSVDGQPAADLHLGGRDASNQPAHLLVLAGAAIRDGRTSIVCPISRARIRRCSLAASIIGVLGLALLAIIVANWEACVQAAKLAGAAQAVTAAAGVTLIGGALIYAGRGRERRSA